MASTLNNLGTTWFFAHDLLIPSLMRDKKVSASFPWAFLEKHEKVLKNYPSKYGFLGSKNKNMNIKMIYIALKCPELMNLEIN